MIIEPLAGHDRTGFVSGSAVLDDWFARYAGQNERSGSSRTYVAVDGNDVVGFVAIAVGQVTRERVPKAVGRNAPADVPVVLIRRLAVATSAQGRGVGRLLLSFALRRALEISDIAGVRAVRIQALDDRAKEYYLQFADFDTLADDPLGLLLSIEDVRRAGHE